MKKKLILIVTIFAWMASTETYGMKEEDEFSDFGSSHVYQKAKDTGEIEEEPNILALTTRLHQAKNDENAEHFMTYLQNKADDVLNRIYYGFLFVACSPLLYFNGYQGLYFFYK